MAKKLSPWRTRGMNKDLSVSVFNPEFSFDNRNIRLSTNDGNTQMSWVNEKGTKKLKLINKGSSLPVVYTSLKGYVLGTAVVGKYLVVFMHDDSASEEERDVIYRLNYKDDSKDTLEYRLLVKKNFYFSNENPIETLVSYESEKIQKVYWVDGKNQPRVINIGLEPEYLQSKPGSYFNFIPTLKLQEDIYIEKMVGTAGKFVPGVIQYAFTYYNNHIQESNIFYTSPLMYVSPPDRGGNPDSMVENSFRITIKNPDTNFDYIRIYSIHRSSIDATPVCKRIQDIQINLIEENTVTFIDNGFIGDDIDPTELLYKGGENIIASTMEQKDNTLFLGDITIKRPSIKEVDIKNWFLPGEDINCSTRSFKPLQVSSGTYPYGNQLTSYTTRDDINVSVPCGGFKRGEMYRLGIQFQYETGKWSEPVHLKDIRMKGIRPEVATDGTISVPVFKYTINSGIVKTLYEAKYRKARAVVVFPEPQDRNILCQGVFNPTMYTKKRKKDKYIQSSWFFRPQNPDISGGDGTYAPTASGVLPYMTRDSNPQDIDGNNTNIRQVEIQGFFKKYKEDEEEKFMNQFYVDTEEFVTMHSPEFEFDDSMYHTEFTNTSFRNVGYVQFKNTMADIEIQTDTPTVSNNAGGFVKETFIKDNAAGIISGLFYEDYIVDDIKDPTQTNEEIVFKAYRPQKEGSPVKWMVYLWNKDGSLNNDVNRPSDKGLPTAKLKKKIISNLRIADTEWNPVLNDDSYDSITSLVNAPKFYSSDQATFVKIGEYFYEGNIDNILIPDATDGVYFAFHKTTDATEGEWDLTKQQVITGFTESVRWKTFSDSPDDDSANTKKYGLYVWDIDPYPDDPPRPATQESWFRPKYKDEESTPTHVQWHEYGYNVGKYYNDLIIKKGMVRMKYKTTPHLIMYLTETERISNRMSFGMEALEKSNTLPLTEIIRSDAAISQRFGGDSADALMANTWIPCGEPVRLTYNTEKGEYNACTIEYSYGDTYFQRWDCLKTYAFTPEDTNQVIEIGSFMLETHCNIDGRYDRNRGQSNNLYMSPLNFNKLNPVYNQKDNFFNYRILKEEYYDDIHFPNQLTWTKTKVNGADVDLWTNITLASILDLDGDKGTLNKLIKFNDQLLAFQDNGISQIMYNENVQINTQQGVPIEIANSGKVQGKRYLTSTVGCSNKWSMAQSPSGIYFMDSDEKGIYLFNGQLDNLSIKAGFNTWCKQNIPDKDVRWFPSGIGSFKNFVAHYDNVNQEVLFVNNVTALAWSERHVAFTSFYDYANGGFFDNMLGTGIWTKYSNVGTTEPNFETVFWQHQTGDEYCCLFGYHYPYSMTLVANAEATMDKIFTNIEFRANMDSDGDYTNEFTPLLPFDSIEAWNEYQHGYTTIENKKGRELYQHGKDNSALVRKFRLWRCDLPRDNCKLDKDRAGGETYDYSTDAELKVSRYVYKPNNRLRNTWLYIKLKKSQEINMKRAEIHDLMLTYYS